MTNVIGIVQARIGSSRLSGKMLLPVLGEPVIVQMLRRVSRARRLGALWLATGDDAPNDELARAVETAGFSVFRGSESDVLDRFHRLALREKADVVVRLTGDCPLHDASVVDLVVEQFVSASPHRVYGSNVFPPTYPDGLDTEVFDFAALDALARTSQNKMEREFVTMGIHRRYHDGGEKPPIVNVSGPSDFSHLRWTLDYASDFEFIRQVYEALHPTNPDFGWLDVVALQTKQPELLSYAKVQARNANVLADVAAGGLETKS
jgi:spore coat polysaccharide biosynthesis protein SpsF (cytidylyltransferase family)